MAWQGKPLPFCNFFMNNKKHAVCIILEQANSWIWSDPLCTTEKAVYVFHSPPCLHNHWSKQDYVRRNVCRCHSRHKIKKKRSVTKSSNTSINGSGIHPSVDIIGSTFAGKFNSLVYLHRSLPSRIYTS